MPEIPLPASSKSTLSGIGVEAPRAAPSHPPSQPLARTEVRAPREGDSTDAFAMFRAAPHPQEGVNRSWLVAPEYQVRPSSERITRWIQAALRARSTDLEPNARWRMIAIVGVALVILAVLAGMLMPASPWPAPSERAGVYGAQ
jgi:hypothetical protein